MGHVMIICPHCDRQIPTGIRATSLAFKNFRFSDGEVLCPHCKNKASWIEKDTFLKRSNLLPSNFRIHTSH